MNKYHNEYYNFGNLGVSFRMLKFIVNQKNLNATLNSRNSYDLHNINVNQQYEIPKPNFVNKTL